MIVRTIAEIAVVMMDNDALVIIARTMAHFPAGIQVLEVFRLADTVFVGFLVGMRSRRREADSLGFLENSAFTRTGWHLIVIEDEGDTDPGLRACDECRGDEEQGKMLHRGDDAGVWLSGWREAS